MQDLIFSIFLLFEHALSYALAVRGLLGSCCSREEFGRRNDYRQCFWANPYLGFIAVGLIGFANMGQLLRVLNDQVLVHNSERYYEAVEHSFAP